VTTVPRGTGGGGAKRVEVLFSQIAKTQKRARMSVLNSAINRKTKNTSLLDLHRKIMEDKQKIQKYVEGCVNCNATDPISLS
jgi:hypothetical protein